MRAKEIFAAACAAAFVAGAASAQTNYVTVTNFVTVTITNVVVITNTAMGPITLGAPTVEAPHKTAKYPWNNSMSAGLTLARGNTDITQVSADYSVMKKTPKDQYSASAGLAYGEQDSRQTADSYKGAIRWDHLFTERFYSYTQGEGLRDYIADVSYRLTVGPGLGYYVLKNTNTSLALGGGVNFESQALGNQGNNFATLRFADKFEYKFNSHARIWQNVELLPQVDRWDNYLVNFEIGAEASITKSFSLKSYLDDNYNNRPAAEHVKNDVRLVAGLAYKF